MKRRHFWIASLLVLLAAVSAAEEAPARLQPREMGEMAASLQPAMVRVHFFLQYDEGEAPTGGLPCPNCGGYHGSASSYIEQERPVESAGYLVSPTEVVTFDPLIASRFVSRIEVMQGETRLDAEPATYFTRRQAMLLRLPEPLEGAVPLEFHPEAAGPYLSVQYTHADGEWLTRVSPFSLAEVERMEDGQLFHRAGGREIVCDRHGTPVAVSMMPRWRIEEDWRLPVASWEGMTVDAVERLLTGLDARLGDEVVRVRLGFRSPRTDDSSRGYMMYYSGRDEEATEMHVPGLIVSPSRVLAVALLEPKVTARLERITVYPANGEPVEAEFRHSLRDHGAILAELETPLPAALPISDSDIHRLREEMLLGVTIRMHGDQRVAKAARARIAGFEAGWRNLPYPTVAGADEGLFLFDREGALLAFPLRRRQKVSSRDRWGYARGWEQLIPVAHLSEALRDPAAHADASNVPLSEEEEARLAWLGVEFQPLTPDLARAQNVAHLTRDGEFGAIASYVYPDSPASRAGVEPGWALLRLHVEDEPRPLEVQVDEGRGRHFEWDMLDQVPDAYFRHISPPWPTAENTFTRAITDIGFGRRYTAEFHRDGETILKEFVIEAAPRHYGMAPRHKSEALGMTVRDLTYEVRRFYQKEADAPGVIVSNIEEGSKASVSGIRPFEIIVEVNDQPVDSAEAFETMIQGQRELRLGVERMARGRVVQIRLDE